jgi:SAM-dependent methyltransferase
VSDLVHRRSDCRFCHGTELELALGLTPTPLADAYVPRSRADEPQPSFPLDLYLCRTCGLVQLLDVVQPQEIYVDYIYESASSLGLADHFDRYAEEVLGRVQPESGSLVIDVGSNDGLLLRSFRDRGMTVLGIDPAVEIARQVTAKGLETLPEFLTPELAERIRDERGPAAVVTANNVIANIDDLDDVMASIRTLLAPDGVFVFESFYLGDLVRNMVFDFFYHEHLSAFSVVPVERFVALHGLELIDALRVPTKGGSLRYTVQPAGGPRPAAGSVPALKREEAEQGLHGLELFRAFEQRIEQARSDVLAELRTAAADGKTIAGYGASATSTTLIYHFELGELLGYIIDDNPARQGLLSPGLHLEVVGSEALYERQPDIVVVLAWRYDKPIIGDHRRFIEQGGRFVVPMPELKVVA